MHQRIADATFQVATGNDVGSGFSYVKDRIVITNYHVVEAHFSSGSPMSAITEAGIALPARILAYSPENEHDFAILELQQPLPSGRHILQPAKTPDTSRGSRLLVSGFPHGIPHLLVHEAVVSAPMSAHAFYIDGSVNGGNSGGPVVSAISGEVVGIVTERRFMGAGALAKLSPRVEKLSQHCAAISRRGKITFNGIDFSEFAALMAEGLTIMMDVVQANANSGIGIGYHINFVNDELRKLGLL